MNTQDANTVEKGLGANRYTVDLRYTMRSTKEVSTETQVMVAALISDWWTGAVADIEVMLMQMGLQGDITVRDDSADAQALHTALNGVMDTLANGGEPENLIEIPDGYDSVVYYDEVDGKYFVCPHCHGDVKDVVLDLFKYDESDEELEDDYEDAQSLDEIVAVSCVVHRRFGQ